MNLFARLLTLGFITSALTASATPAAIAAQPTKKQPGSSSPTAPAAKQPAEKSPKEGPGDEEKEKGKIDLRPKFTKGQRLVYTMNLESKSKTRVPALEDTDQEQSTKQELGLVFVVKDTSEAEGSTIELTFSKVKITQETGKGKDKETVEFDSSRPKAKDKDNPLAPAGRELAGTTFTISIDKDGQVTNVAGGSGLASLGSLGTPPSGLGNIGGGSLPGAGGGMPGGGGGGGGIGDAIGSIFQIKKGSPFVKVGEKWTTSDEIDSGLLGKFKMITDSNVKSHSGNQARVKVSGRIEPASQGGGGGLSMFQVKDSIYLGEYLWDTREGALKSLDMDQSVTIDGGANGGINMTASSKMKVNRVR